MSEAQDGESIDYAKAAKGQGEIDPEYAKQQAAAPEPIRRMDIDLNPRTLINMQRDRRSIT